MMTQNALREREKASRVIQVQFVLWRQRLDQSESDTSRRSTLL